MFTLGRFGSIKINSGAIALLVWFIYINANADILQLFNPTEQCKSNILGKNGMNWMQTIKSSCKLLKAQ